MNTLSWSGIANIDCRYDEKEKHFKIIEINTRFWLNTDASAIAGINFPFIYCLSSLHKLKEDIPRVDLIRYYNLKGLLSKVKSNPFFLTQKKVLKNSPLRFVFSDPIPMIYKYVWRTKNIILSSQKMKRAN